MTAIAEVATLWFVSDAMAILMVLALVAWVHLVVLVLRVAAIYADGWHGGPALNRATFQLLLDSLGAVLLFLLLVLPLILIRAWSVAEPLTVDFRSLSFNPTLLWLQFVITLVSVAVAFVFPWQRRWLAQIFLIGSSLATVLLVSSLLLDFNPLERLPQ